MSAVISLRAGETTVLPAYLGRAVHGLFLRLTAGADAEMGTRLHEDSNIKPFTVSDVLGLPRRGKRAYANAGVNCLLRVTSYEDGLSSLLLDRVLPRLPAHVELEGSPFSVEDVFVDSGAHPLSAQTTYRELAEHYLLRVERPTRKVKLFFASPTTFRSRNKNVPLPLPWLVLGSLAERWNAFSPITIPAEIRRYAEESLALSQCQVRTRMVEVAGGRQVGFVGSCTYTALTQECYWHRVTLLLAAFAFYAGVGYKTTMGLGQTYLRPFLAGRPHSAGASNI